MSNQLQQSSNFLASKRIKVQQDWIEACIEWLISEHQGQVIAQNKLNDLIYEQWLMADLQDIAEPCLPTNFRTMKGQGSLDGVYMLQVNFAINIGESAYSQYQKLKGQETDDTVEGPENTNTEREPKWKPKATRMIFLELTDGTSKIEAIEYRPISAFDNSISPGCKIRLSGSISSFDGLLLLQKENISILGGNAEELTSVYSTAALLKSTLAIHDDENKTGADEARRETRQVEEQNRNRQPEQTENNSLILLPDNEDYSELFADIPDPDLLGSAAETNSGSNRGQDHDELKCEKVTVSAASMSNNSVASFQETREKNNPSRFEKSSAKDEKRTNNKNTRLSMQFNMSNFDDFDDDFENDFELLSGLSQLTEQDHRENIQETLPVKPKATTGEESFEPKTHVDKNVLQNATVVSVKSESRNTNANSERRKTNAKDQNTEGGIVKLADATVPEKYCSDGFSIKGRVMSLLTQLRTYPTYHLRVSITDGTANIEATIDAKVITKLIGYTAHELESFKTKHPRVRGTVKEAVLNSQRKLAASSWKMDLIRIESEQRYSYKIVNMEEID